jgi:hypothetical protein
MERLYTLCKEPFPARQWMDSKGEHNMQRIKNSFILVMVIVLLPLSAMADTIMASQLRTEDYEQQLRSVLQTIEYYGWFENFNEDARRSLTDTIQYCGLPLQGSTMEAGVQSDGYTPARALLDLFVLCYGAPELWYTQLTDWCNDAFESFGLVRPQETPTPDAIVSLCQALITQYWTVDLSYQAQVTQYEIETKGHTFTQWLIVLYSGISPTSFWYAFIYSDPPGSLYGQFGNTSDFTTDPMYLQLKAQFEWEQEKGLSDFWPIEEMALFNETVSTPLGLPDGHRLPADGEITEAQAIAIAQQTLTQTYGVSQATLDQLWRSAELLDWGEGDPFWLVKYCDLQSTGMILFNMDYTISIDARSGLP